MQQRRLRLGDILDDYCPRERRITNHAVVAIVEDEVKQTRCTTCDADHEYKHAKLPAPRRRKPDAGLSGEVEGMLRPRPATVEGAIDPDVLDEQDHEQEPDGDQDQDLDLQQPDMLADSDADLSLVDADGDAESDEGLLDEPPDEGPVHRRLIRATLPRQEGQTPERKATDFTVRQPGGGGRGSGGREFDGNRTGYRPSGPGGPGGRGSGTGGSGGGRRPMRTQGGSPGQPSRFGGGGGGGGPRNGSGQGQRPPGTRPGGGPPGGNRGGGRPPGQSRGPGGGGGRKRGR